jgi:prevent-host-death family protein
MKSTVGARELKTHMGRYLRLVRGGATLIITDRGKPVAELRPVAAEVRGLDEVLADLEALGEISIGRGEPLPERKPHVLGGVPLSETISDEREDRL